MKKLGKIKLQSAVVLENREMKQILGGSGTGCNPANGHVCEDVPCSDSSGEILIIGRCKWEDFPVLGRLCTCVGGTGGSGAMI